jgi:hypothetical protein
MSPVNSAVAISNTNVSEAFICLQECSVNMFISMSRFHHTEVFVNGRVYFPMFALHFWTHSILFFLMLWLLLFHVSMSTTLCRFPHCFICYTKSVFHIPSYMRVRKTLRCKYSNRIITYDSILFFLVCVPFFLFLLTISLLLIIINTAVSLSVKARA